MKLVFNTNTMNHYQIPLADALNSKPGVEFSYITTDTMSEERRALGFQDWNHSRDYIIRSNEGIENKQKAQKVSSEADVMIAGMAPKEAYHEHELKGKPLFMYSERVYKTPLKWTEIIPRRILYYFRHKRFKNKYMLCASAFTAGDYYRTRTYVNKTYKWAYFPKAIPHDIKALLESKRKERIRIIWSGRYLDWKHPEAAVILGEYLKNKGYKFDINMIGTGEMLPEIEKMVKDKNLEDCVHICGSMTPDEVRNQMEEANIFIFTSDRGEGWGVVLNEAMNSGCAVVGGHAIGSVPYLIKDGENGFIFESKNWNSLCKKVEILMKDQNLREKFGTKAYNTITDTWNGDVAAERFLVLVDCIKNGKETPYKEGPCSRAEILFDNWYKEESE